MQLLPLTLSSAWVLPNTWWSPLAFGCKPLHGHSRNDTGAACSQLAFTTIGWL